MEGERPARGWYWLLAVPLVGLLVPPIYNSADPTLIGIPFFYWHQLLAVNLIVVVLGSLFLNALKAPRGEDVTRPEDYEASGGEPVPATPQQEPDREPARVG